MSTTKALHMGSRTDWIAEQGLRSLDELIIKRAVKIASKDPSQQELVFHTARKVRSLVSEAREFFRQNPDFKGDAEEICQLTQRATQLVGTLQAPAIITMKNCATYALGILTLANRLGRITVPHDEDTAPLDDEDICNIAAYAHKILVRGTTREEIDDAWAELHDLACVPLEEGHQKALKELRQALREISPQTDDCRDALCALNRLDQRESTFQALISAANDPVVSAVLGTKRKHA